MVFKVGRIMLNMTLNPFIIQPTLFVNLDHEVIFKNNLVGIFIVSLVLISYNYLNTMVSKGKFQLSMIYTIKNSPYFQDEIPIFSEFEMFMMAGGLRKTFFFIKKLIK